MLLYLNSEQNYVIMPRVPKIFSNKQIKDFINQHMDQLPYEVTDYITKLSNSTKEDVRPALMSAFWFGMYTGMINGIACFSGDIVEGVSDVPKDNQWHKVNEDTCVNFCK